MPVPTIAISNVNYFQPTQDLTNSGYQQTLTEGLKRDGTGNTGWDNYLKLADYVFPAVHNTIEIVIKPGSASMYVGLGSLLATENPLDVRHYCQCGITLDETKVEEVRGGDAATGLPWTRPSETLLTLGNIYKIKFTNSALADDPATAIEIIDLGIAPVDWDTGSLESILNPVPNNSFTTQLTPLISCSDPLNSGALLGVKLS